jgi:hypothetical protein
MSLHDHLTAEDFLLVIRPVKAEDTETIPLGSTVDEIEYEAEPEETPQVWTGEVQVAIIADAENSSLTKEEFNNMVALCNCTAASIPAMEENPFIREIIQAYAHNRLISPVPERLIKYTDNVLKFDTDTKGTA